MRRSGNENCRFTLDILGEAVISDAEAEQHFHAYVDLLTGVTPTVNGWPADPRIDEDNLGPLPHTLTSRSNFQQINALFDPIDPVGVTRRVGERLKALLRVAQEHQALINVDMESYEKRYSRCRSSRACSMTKSFAELAISALSFNAICAIPNAISTPCDWGRRTARRSGSAW